MSELENKFFAVQFTSERAKKKKIDVDSSDCKSIE